MNKNVTCLSNQKLKCDGGIGKMCEVELKAGDNQKGALLIC